MFECFATVTGSWKWKFCQLSGICGQ